MRFRLLVVLLAFVVANTTIADESRFWTARAGGFKVEATLVDVTEGNVVLQKIDGSTVTVPLEKLSLSGIRFIDQVMRQAEASVNRIAPAKEMKESLAPQAPDDPPQSTEDAPAETAPLTNGSIPPLTEPNRSDWQLQPDPGSTAQINAARNLAKSCDPFQFKVRKRRNRDAGCGQPLRRNLPSILADDVDLS